MAYPPLELIAMKVSGLAADCQQHKSYEWLARQLDRQFAP
jgi:hypothetical protein